jgi:hypothetical protein
VRGDDVVDRFAAERQLTAHEVVERDAERVEVRAMVDRHRETTALLGRHVVQRALRLGAQHAPLNGGARLGVAAAAATAAAAIVVVDTESRETKILHRRTRW